MENATSISASNTIDFKISLTSIQNFAKFLFENKEEVSKDFFNLYCERKLALINLFDHDGKKEVKDSLTQDFESFLLSLINGNVVEKELLKLKYFKTNIPDFPDFKARPLDQSLRFHLIKKTFLKFLPDYRVDLGEALNIIKELEEIILYVDHHFANLQVDINRQNLQKERDFANSLIDHSTNGIIAFNNETIITSWNNIIERISGIHKNFVVGKKVFELFPEFRNSDEGDAILKVLKGEIVEIDEKPFANNNGFYEATAVPLYGLQNEIVGGFIVFKDVTEQKRSAQELELSKSNLERANKDLQVQIEEYKKSQDLLKSNEKLLKKTQELAHIGTWEWDVRENEIRWSDELKKLFNIEETIEKSSIKSYMSRVHSDDRELFLKRIREAVRSKFPFDYEHRIVLADGSVRYIFGQGVPQLTDGKFQIIGFAQDVTQKRKAIETLQSSENRFRTLCEKSPDAIFLVDNEKIIYCNISAVSLLGAQNKADVLKGNFTRLSANISSEVLEEKLKDALDGENIRFEFTLKRFKEDPIWCEVIFTPIQLEDKNILHAVVRDISKRKKIEEDITLAQDELMKINNQLESRIRDRTYDLEETNKSLKRVNADLDNFIYTASHDLKAPILNIEGLVREVMQLDCYHMHDDLQLLVDMIMICVNKFKKTIEDLSDITKNIKSDAEHPRAVQISELVEDIEISIKKLITSSNSIIEKDFSDINTLYFSRKNLRSVLFNLISNAIKYRSPERTPKLFITSKKEGDFTVISVNDNGLGLKPSDKEKVFTIFKRIHTSVEGSGVGLYLVKRIMENSGGYVDVESEEGVGSTFKLYFRNSAD